MFLDLTVWLLVLILVYTWIVYPLVLAALARGGPAVAKAMAGKQETREENPDVPHVIVDILLAAYNEEDCIGARLRNLIDAAHELNTPTRQYSNSPVRIWLGIDGATDRTAEIAHGFAAEHEQVHVCEFPERRGKVAILKDLVVESGEADGGRTTEDERKRGGERVLVFTDANTVFRSGALGKLLGHFGDPNVGGVCGQLVLLPTHSHTHTLTHSSPEGAYWSWENRMKQRESRIDSCLGANGAIYAIRRGVFWEDIPDNTIVEDLVIGMKVRESGRRMVYEPGAVAEEEAPIVADEWHRRVRIGAGDYQALWLCRRCLAPGYGRLAWMFWSHKVLRWFTPQILVLLYVMSCLRPLLLTCLSLLVVAGAIGAVFSETRSNVLRPFVLCDHFLTMQAALLAGFIRFCRGRLTGTWQRTPRQ